MAWQVKQCSASSGVATGNLLEYNSVDKEIQFSLTGDPWGGAPTPITINKGPTGEPVIVDTYDGTMKDGSGRKFRIMANESTAVCLIVGSTNNDWWNAQKA